MATEKNEKLPGYEELHRQVQSGSVGNVYIFQGEETYLMQQAVAELQALLVPPGFEEFNYHRLSGKGLTVQEVTEAVEAMPMMAEHTFVTVTDMDIFKLDEPQRTALTALLGDFPEYCTLVFLYRQIPYKKDARLKKLASALAEHAQEIEFAQQGQQKLFRWVRRRFAAMDKEIDDNAVEHLLFTCGSLMDGLVPEIAKIGAYAKGKNITTDDINAVADPVLDAVVFDMTNAITKRDYGRASELLGQLLKKQEEPFVILAVISKELRRIYTARIALDNGKDKLWLMELWGMRSDYPARLLMEAARKTTSEWCSQSLLMCQRLDQRMKSEKGIDSEGELKLLLMRLAQGK